MLSDMQNTSGFESLVAYPDWVFANQPIVVGEEVTQITGQAGGNVISITGSVNN